MNPGILNYHNYCYLQIPLIIDTLIDTSVDVICPGLHQAAKTASHECLKISSHSESTLYQILGTFKGGGRWCWWILIGSYSSIR